MLATDPYFKKVITFRYWKQELKLRVSQDLFSSYDIDIGTRFLLRTLAEVELQRFRKILDLGCGYGPIGLTLKKVSPGLVVHLVDRDALAVEYSRQNAELNRVSDVEVYGSLGYDNVHATDFDLIVSNVPGKAGEQVISSLLGDAAYFLNPDGLVAIVVVTALEDMVLGILRYTLVADISLKRVRSGHSVFHYQFGRRHRLVTSSYVSAFERRIYERNRVNVSLHGLQFPMVTARGLPEFDSPSFQTQLLCEGLGSIRRPEFGHVIAFNPGQGHIAVALWKLLKPSTIHLVGRDLLSLYYSKINLIQNYCPEHIVSISHQVGIDANQPKKADLIIGTIREDEGPEAAAATVRKAAQQLSCKGILILSGSSTAITRVVRTVESLRLFKGMERKRRRGDSLLIMQVN